MRRNNNLLLYIAIGDATCLATEFVAPDKHTKLIEAVLRLDQYHTHPRYGIGRGCYTDDTQMSIGVAEALLTHADDPRSLTSEHFVDHWLRAFHRDRRLGYAKGFQAFLESHETVEAFLRDIRPTSERNGGCMRVVPVGVLKDVSDVLHVADVQARVTHNSPQGVLAAKAVALMSHFALHHADPLQTLKPFLIHHLKDDLSAFEYSFDHPWNGRIGDAGMETAQAVLQLLCTCTSLSDVLRQTVRFGGDTDSVAAIALGIASCRLPDDLPQVLFDDLENGVYGRTYLQSLGTQLMDAFIPRASESP